MFHENWVVEPFDQVAEDPKGDDGGNVGNGVTGGTETTSIPQIEDKNKYGLYQQIQKIINSEEFINLEENEKLHAINTLDESIHLTKWDNIDEKSEMMKKVREELISFQIANPPSNGYGSGLLKRSFSPDKADFQAAYDLTNQPTENSKKLKDNDYIFKLGGIDLLILTNKTKDPTDLLHRLLFHPHYPPASQIECNKGCLLPSSYHQSVIEKIRDVITKNPKDYPTLYSLLNYTDPT